MRNWTRRVVSVGAVTAALVALVVVPAGAGNGARQIGGAGVVHAVSDGITPAFTPQCPEPAGYGDFSWITLDLQTGNLQGCWYTLVEEYSFSPNEDASPVTYHEVGREVFVGSLYADDGTSLGDGTFETTYRFTAKYTDASLVEEIHGRCQHPLVAGSGTGVFAGMTGRVDFKDDVATGVLTYRGHLK